MFLYAEINPDYADVTRVADERAFRREYAQTAIKNLDALKPFTYWGSDVRDVIDDGGEAPRKVLAFGFKHSILQWSPGGG
ncbi:hypothetical protein N2603_41140 [Bradyrhizobium huanghuaihaiense]|uniref:hypothetical protein n=1 Tax=Bradyrhizobium huanghuaihaiense TaxID=990078 RepID=UPI0021AA6FA2|nr:hypothetical protein [Bradyrhizobium sp. CB3035]UWU76219.1 hypothetical protein N2603_41140 [Bradyrhizobium sp. CB3035]